MVSQAAISLHLRQALWRNLGDLQQTDLCDPEAAAGLALVLDQLHVDLQNAPKMQGLAAMGSPALCRVARCSPAQIRRWWNRAYAPFETGLQRMASGPSSRPAIGSRHDCSRAAILR